MKKESLHIIGIITAIFMIFILGVFIGRQQVHKEMISTAYTATTIAPTENNERRININTATHDELCTLPGIGEATADAIINYRTENGPFDFIEQLMNVKGIGYKKFDGIIDLICLE